MIIPMPVELQTIPQAGVFANTTWDFFIKTAPDTAVDLGNGQTFTGLSPTATYYYFPGAALVLT